MHLHASTNGLSLIAGVVVAAMLLLSSANATSFGASRGDVLFVDDDAAAGGDGRSWSSAFHTLQDALTHARQPGAGVTEIRVGQGIYAPDQGAGMIPGDQYSAFDLVSGVVLRGGYAGVLNPRPDQRDPKTFVSTLTGDLLRNDLPNFQNYTDNCFRVVRAVELQEGTAIEGMLITASQQEPYDSLIGGGVFCISGHLRIADCRFERNRAYTGGAIGVRLEANVQVFATSFSNNRAVSGGAITAYGATPTILAQLLVEDCHFEQNDTQGQGNGGALFLFHVAATIRRSSFHDNWAHAGAAILGSLETVVEDCTFTEHFATWGACGGNGVYRDCVFEDNEAGDQGGAYWWGAPGAKFVDCHFARNRCFANKGGAAYGGAAFIGCTFVDNDAGAGGGGDVATGGAIATRVPCFIADCTFIGNHAAGVGGAIGIAQDGSATITNCTFVNNSSDIAGEAIGGPATICNSIFGEHEGPPLSGVTSVDYSCLPPAFPFAGGTGNIAADARFVDPLGPDGIPGTEDDDLRLRADSPCIDAGDSTALPPDQFDLDGDGDITEPLPVDMLGNRRVLFAPPHMSPPDTGVPDGTGAIIDMGAHEFRRPVDCAPPTPPIGDGFVNIDDLLTVISGWGRCERGVPCLADVNADSTVDIHDLLAVLTGWG